MLKPCPFCGSCPTFSCVYEYDDRRYMRMKLECCATMTAGISWHFYKNMIEKDIKDHLQKELIKMWNTRFDIIEQEFNHATNENH